MGSWHAGKKSKSRVGMSRRGESRCYAIREIPTIYTGHPNQRQLPILPGVDAVVIMTNATIEGRKRVKTFVRKYGRLVEALCPKAMFQINHGFQRCYKGGVLTSSADYVHAMLEAFRNTQRFQNVLILQDNVVFDLSGLQLKLALYRVGRFIVRRQRMHKPFNTYNLGCLAHALLPCGENLQHRKIVGFLGCTQAVVWSREARHALLRSIDVRAHAPGCMPTANDRSFIPQLETHAYTYKRPIATQTFDSSFLSKPARYPQCHSKRSLISTKWVRFVTGLGIRLLRLDKTTRPGWNVLNGFGMGLTTFLALMCAAIVSLKVVGAAAVPKIALSSRAHVTRS